jgi:chromo domain-containing protein 1
MGGLPNPQVDLMLHTVFGIANCLVDVVYSCLVSHLHANELTGTWEPPEHLRGTSLIQAWTRKRVAMGEDNFIAYTEKNMAEYKTACDKAAEAKQRRQEKREKKRWRLGLTKRSIFDQDSSSDENVQLTSRRKPGHHEPNSPDRDSLFVDSNEHLPKQSEKLTVSSALAKPPLVSRRAPLEQSSSDSESLSSGGSKPLPTKTRKKTEQAANKSPQRRGSHMLGNSILQPRSSEHKTHAASNLVVNQKSSSAATTMTAQMPSAPPTAPKAMLQRPNSPDRLNSQQSDKHAAVSAVSGPTAASRNTTIASVGTGSRPVTLTAPGTSKHSSNPNTAIRTSSKSTTQAVRKPTSVTRAPGPIKFVDQPTVQRKEWQSDKEYSTLKFRHNAAKRSQVEKPPDVGSLSFVNCPPAGLSTVRPSTRADNPYGRRDMTDFRARDDDAGEDLLRNDMSRRSSDIAVEPLAPWEVDKVPVVCPEWRLSNNCTFGAQKCRYMHRDRDPLGKDYPIGDIYGYIEPKHRTPPAMCMFWYNTTCNKPADICPFAHKYTGYTLRGSKMVSIEPDDKAKQPIERTKQPNENTKRTKEKGPPNSLTCWFWKNSKCRKTAETCAYRHYDTSAIAVDPRTRIDVSVNGTEIQPRISAGASDDTPHELPAQTGSRCTIPTNKREEVSTKSHDRELVADEPADGAAFFSDIGTTQVDSLQSCVQPTPDLVQQSTTSVITQEPGATHTQPNLMTCLALKEMIEQACRLEFTDMFSISINGRKTTLAKTAFLILHPEAHAAELDLITRWLLMHHVTVSNMWYDGAWNYFREQVIRSGSGLVIVSEDSSSRTLMLILLGTS